MLSWLKGIICCPAGCSESAVRETTNSLFWQSQHVAREHPDHTKKVTGYNGHVASSWQRSDYHRYNKSQALWFWNTAEGEPAQSQHTFI